MRGAILQAVLGFILACLCGAGTYSGGAGSTGDPYLISDVDDLLELTATSKDWSLHFRQTADIFAGNYVSAIAIGYWEDYGEPNNKPFSGVYDGDGYMIDQYQYIVTGVDGVALFQFINADAVVKNLTLKNPYVHSTGAYNVAGLVAVNEAGQIINCRMVDGDILGGWYVGGIAADSNGVISDCVSSGVVEAPGYYPAGVCGYNSRGDILRCGSTAKVIGGIFAGGLCGINNRGFVSHCWATGDVSGHSIIDGCGGLVGQNSYATVRDSWASGNVIGYDDRIGGLVGEASGLIYRCYATGDITGGNETGGLVGIAISGFMLDCYSLGDVNGVDKVGGLIGYNFGMDVNDCYSAGKVRGTTNRGGLVGDTGFGGSYVSCFWDKESSGVLSSDGGTPKTTLQMNDKATFESAGWDLELTWAVDATERKYPYLHMYLPSDLNHDGVVDLQDFAVVGGQWLMER